MEIKNGILLAGGNGTRLQPITNYYNKSMVPIKNKFIIDYSIETIKSAGVVNLTVILGGAHFAQVVTHLKDGKQHGLNINYCFQNEPLGIAHAINLCKRFVADNDKFVVMLGDNIFQNPIEFNDSNKSSQIMLYQSSFRHSADLKKFGVASLGKRSRKIVKIEEKPKELNIDYDQYAITGCYLFNQKFFEFYTELKPSTRGEYEIAHIIDLYKKCDDLGHSYVDGWWHDAGSFESIDEIYKLMEKS